ncbi:hypothetical protein JN01_0505 [Entomoplasma freundtii]|uniref:Zinc metalloprotease n=1 Tax=Entomoplasma freundtii TaxID=74700 RepID=A0A2K8NQH4_9MOLU|nr:SprT family zinc-dependent metalloprotease [Entomoplasma freundtii]ATZ16095.1 zinc metalloprotease [Entomoplasma freundtii]TDY57004.1 hypothetical protein JN01_0505 [Entomoplasma freundtii]
MSNIFKKKLVVKGHVLNYELRFRPQKNIIIRIREGQLFISAPEGTPDWEIERAIYRHYEKITIVQNRYEEQSKYELYGSNKWIKIFDKPIPILLEEEMIHARLVNGCLTMHNYWDQEVQLKKIYNFLSQFYKNWFYEVTSQWALKMGVEFKTISLRIMNLKWGVCYPETGKIIFNPKLLHFPASHINYVIVHELAHLNHPNHSTAFWREVERFLPNYRELKAKINQAGL